MIIRDPPLTIKQIRVHVEAVVKAPKTPWPRIKDISEITDEAAAGQTPWPPLVISDKVPRKRRGRPLGASVQRRADQPRYDEMRILIRDEGLTPHAAAIRVATKTLGTSKTSSTVARLRKGYVRKYGWG